MPLGETKGVIETVGVGKEGVIEKGDGVAIGKSFPTASR